MEDALPLVWAMIIAAAVFLYVCMDGFDLGLGILFPWFQEKEERDVMVNSVAPVWDGNETWLVMGGAGLYGVFPLAYATIFPALYMPLVVMLLALIFRGVSFEMRFKAETAWGQLWWDRSFSWGSYVATFCQGIALGALVQGIRVENRSYAGGWWDWLTPFSLLTGVALLIGYGLLGACWMIWRSEGAIAAKARRLARVLGVATLACIGLVSLIMPFLQPAFFERWFSFPGIVAASPVPLLVLLLAWLFFRAVPETEAWEAAAPHDPSGRGFRWRDGAPFLCVLGWFFLAYTGLGISLWPNIVPPSISIWDAAASTASLTFLLVGAAVLIPIILCYTAYTYWLFRGKVRIGEGYH
ncbi:cytochrome d ubiquinol oxidase subunit II [Roseomonas marmotae]|uniref:Cytochrome d ubiquinol oxidase subunit II n=1 Tax=Roseomonas marmotae TaxID=2768161 RepID=A0ABS3KCZ0_9PROT|nr:cytochrome d ubiquinol oxidase subunit II [Roseomonas marmotae]MBO1075312.1 cytochrome d ubiquinol oxidase subunit II [Roseomonas marmotae]QTI78291.1 cytochrome d ubiquinol oxidase subunit II [Roseomonas marmotae]